MMKLFADKEILLILSDLFTNLAAGWFALIFIGQTLGGINNTKELLLFLTVNILSGTVSVVLAVTLAKIAKTYE